MIISRLLRSIFKRHVLRSELGVKVNWDFHLIRWHVQEELIQRRHHSCLRSLMSFISFQLFNVLKFTSDHLISITLHQVRLFLQSQYMSNSFSKLYTKISTFTLNSSSFSLRDNKITLVRSVSHTFRTLERLWFYMIRKRSRHTLLT